MAILVLHFNILYFFQLTFGPFDPVQIDRNQFQSLYQVAPKDTALLSGIASLMLHFSWNWVGLLIPADQRGAQFLSDFRKELDKTRICIAFVQTVLYLGETLLRLISQDHIHIIESSTADVIVIYGPTSILLTLIESTYRKYNMKKIWVMNTKWFCPNIELYNMLELSHGALIFSPHYEEIAGFKKFMQEATPIKYPEDIFLHILWYWYFKCSFLHFECKIFKNCLQNASLELLPGNIFTMTMTEESYYVYNAVYAVAHSLHEETLSQIQYQPQSNIDRTLLFPWQVM